MKYRVVFFNAVTCLLVAALVFGADFIVPGSAQAGPPSRGQARMSIHGSGKHGGGHNTNVNVNVNHNGGGHHDDHHDHHHHDVIGGVVAGAITGLAIGAIVTAASMPSGCSDIIIGGIAYRQCGSTWYQPYYQGTTVQYIVVNPPR
nr:hypothetical protein [uncultured Desulfobacter sp.]